MAWRLAADAALVLHLTFIIFVIVGAALTVWWRWIPVLHLPAAAWGVLIELGGGACPLTGIENAWRLRAGQSGYEGGFIEHYLLPVIYPAGLTHDVQFAFAAGVLVVNVALYGWLIARYRRRRADV